MIIVWDCKTGRREFIEMLLKKEKYEVFSSTEVNSGVIEQIQSLEPVLIIASKPISTELNMSCETWVLGSDIELPIEPLSFLNKISKKLR